MRYPPTLVLHGRHRAAAPPTCCWLLQACKTSLWILNSNWTQSGPMPEHGVETRCLHSRCLRSIHRHDSGDSRLCRHRRLTILHRGGGLPAVDSERELENECDACQYDCWPEDDRDPESNDGATDFRDGFAASTSVRSGAGEAFVLGSAFVAIEVARVNLPVCARANVPPLCAWTVVIAAMRALVGSECCSFVPNR